MSIGHIAAQGTVGIARWVIRIIMLICIIGALANIGWIFTLPFLKGAYQIEQEKAAIASHERNFRVICPEYAEESFVIRWTGLSNISWCADYMDRL